MRKSLRFLKNMYAQRIQVRLSIYFMLILIPLVAVSLFANFRSTNILEGQTSERTQNSLLSILQNIDMTLQNMEDLSGLISTDYSIKPVLHEAHAVLLTSDLYSFYTIMERLGNIMAINGSLQEISILHASSGTLLSTQYGGRKVDFEEEPWFQSTVAARGKLVLYLPQPKDADILGSDTVAFMRLMDVDNQDNTSNILMMTMAKERLLDMIRGAQLTSNTDVYLYAQDGRLLTGTDGVYDTDQWMELKAGQVGRTVDGKLVWRMESAESGWSLVLVQPQAELYKESRQLSQFTNLIILISVILALLISLGVYKWISAPLTILLHGMKQMRLGQFHTRLPNLRTDELGALTESFNQMIAEQQLLIRDVYEHQLQLSKTELKFLHSQINPHFLYNTLDSIYWTAKNYEADEISEMVLNLSKFFRLSLGKGRETFTVEETVEHLTYYLKVQQFRFMGLFSIRFEIEESTRSMCVLKLLLQPIVENAILHGLEKRGDGGELIIASATRNGILSLQVKDNGAGISEERLRYIVSVIEGMEQGEASRPDERNEEELFGLRNVLSRMKLYYGDGAKLRIESERGKWTIVTMIFPIDRLEDKSA